MSKNALGSVFQNSAYATEDLKDTQHGIVDQVQETAVKAKDKVVEVRLSYPRFLFDLLYY